MVERARELLSHRIPSGDRLEISKYAYSLLIDSLERKTRAKADRPRPRPRTQHAKDEATRGISRQATRAMFEEHGDQCSFVDETTGVRCSSRTFIQRDHIHMRAHGGSDEAENLRPMCQGHNLLLAELALGRAYVEKRIHFRRRRRGRMTA